MRHTAPRLEHIKLNLWSEREKTLAVELLIMWMDRITFARSPPWHTVGAGCQIRTRNRRRPVHKLNGALLVDGDEGCAETFGTTSPRYMRQDAIRFPLRSSQLTFMRQAQKQTWWSPPPTVARGGLFPLTWSRRVAKHDVHAQVGHQIRLKPGGSPPQGTSDTVASRSQ